MNLSYFRIKLSQEESINRLQNWIGKAPKEVIETNDSNAVDVACENETWKGRAVYVYHNAPWTVFEDLSGGFSVISAENWLQFAEKNSLIVAGYNDAILFAEFIIIENGVVIRDFFEDYDNPEDNRNLGILPFEKETPIESWIDVAAFVDDDDIVSSENGTVLIF